MLNGKFFSGLPPKMMERGGGGAVPNRQESHLFWPDDTKAESAIESRLKRRNSVQLQTNDKPNYIKQFSGGGNDDVDTKRRFNKEFSQSSIQFCDNLNENSSTPSRRPLLRSGVGKKTELAEKPTATKLKLPETIVDEAYTSAKRKQAYMSKIEFYDFVNEEEEHAPPPAKSQQNNFRKPKMDMNDKREMELNSKNSPKLQIKRDVRSLSEEKDIPKINNNRYTKTLERPTKQIKEVNVAKGNRNEYRDGRAEERSNVRSSERNVYDSRYSNEEEELGRHVRKSEDYYEKPSRSVLSKERNYRNYEEDRDFVETPPPQRYRRNYDAREEDLLEEPEYRRIQNETKTNRGRRDNVGDVEEIGERMRKVRIEPSPPRRHQYYPEEYYADEEPIGNYRRNRISPTRTRGNIQRRTEIRAHEQLYENDSHPYEEDGYEVMNNKTGNRNGSNSGGGSHKENVKQVTNKLNNNIYSRKYAADMSSPSPEPVTRKSSTPLNSASPETEQSPPPATTAADVNKPRKHLRSSLCFHDGAIIAENDATTAQSPTSEKPITRRNIRSSATKRVSVGLPDY
ncbi:uncharacterized protein [Musca autumnalis]|uniref:uncharacterized protein n=1 Tax=Musca autumnalis TaxID=221902 RepID=UPI003CF807DB